jgi:hypothetical protein
MGYIMSRGAYRFKKAEVTRAVMAAVKADQRVGKVVVLPNGTIEVHIAQGGDLKPPQRNERLD